VCDAGLHDHRLPKKYPHLHNETKPTGMSIKEERTVRISGGDFTMGVKDPKSQTGEYPPRKISNIKPFLMDKYPVTVGDFISFKRFKAQFKTTAEKKGWSWVFLNHAHEFTIKNPNITHPHEEKWWQAVQGASWKKPFGVTAHTDYFFDFPVTHVSYHDAEAFCYWQNKRLPTEQEWEYAARGNKKGERYPWGERFEKKRMNVWQGLFPGENRKTDGYVGVSPVKAYPAQNDIGIYDMVGNVWEWTDTLFSYPKLDPRLPPPDVRPVYKPRNGTKWFTVKGGSFLDSKDGKVNLEARCAARHLFPIDYTAENVGFRCAKSMSAEPKKKEPEIQIGANIHSHKGIKKGEAHDLDPDGSFATSVKKGLQKLKSMNNLGRSKQEL